MSATGVDNLLHIKQKLSKYCELKNDAKVQEYLDQLNKINMSLDLLKKSELGKCLQKLKKDKKAYSNKAGEIVEKWKKLITVNAEPEGSTEDSKKTSKTEAASKPSKSLNNSSSKKRNSSSQLPTDANVPVKKLKLSLSDYINKKGDLIKSEPTEPQTESEESQDPFADESSFNKITEEITKNLQLKMANKPKEEPKKVVKPSRPPPKSSQLTVAPKTFQLPQTSAMIDLTKSSSSISRPLSKPAVPPSVPKITNIDNDISQYLSTKQKKRLMYTGKKEVSTTVPQLHDMCVRNLVDSLDELPVWIYTFNLTTKTLPVAYELVKPVLERANAKQLVKIESYSPDFVQHSDELWKKLCLKEFKDCEPEEDESWRELYFRKHDAKETKFRQTCMQISSKHANAPKGRKTLFASESIGMRSSTLDKNNPRGSIKATLKAALPLELVPMRSSNNSSKPAPRPHLQQKPTASLMAKTLKMMKNTRR